jgi:phosphoglycerate dehydrogenase-like enzyme
MRTIVVDENIALGKEAFSGLGKVEILPGRKIDRKSLTDAEALIVRSITKVNEELLRGTPVKFVGTATIGTDHMITDYLASEESHLRTRRDATRRSAEYILRQSSIYFAQKWICRTITHSQKWNRKYREQICKDSGNYGDKRSKK